MTEQFSLHSLNITTGAENANSPVVVSGSVPGTTVYDGDGETLAFNAAWHWQRTGLTLLRGSIYFGIRLDWRCWPVARLAFRL